MTSVSRPGRRVSCLARPPASRAGPGHRFPAPTFCDPYPNPRRVRLGDFRRREEVVLWFEHDLYDRLQLLKILAWFDSQEFGNTRLTLLELDQHPKVTPFYGLGQLNGPQLAALFPSRVPVTAERLEQAAKSWLIFTSTSHGDRRGLDRLLEEYPGLTDGLSRTERQLLLAAWAGATSREDLYLNLARRIRIP